MVAGPGGGVAFLGDKRSGKTTSVLSALLSGLSYVSNDDLSISRDGDGSYTGHGWPRSVPVRKDTFAALRLPLADRLVESGLRLGHPSNATLDDLLDDDERRVGLVTFYPDELCSLFATTAMAAAPVRVVVFPRFAADRRAVPRLTRMPVGQAARAIERNLLTNPVKLSGFLLPHFRLPTAAELADAAEGMARDLPCYELEQGFDRARDGGLLVRELLERASRVSQEVMR
jgi:hypothetical protein